MAPKKLTYKPGDGCYASAATVALRVTPFDPSPDVFANISQANLSTWAYRSAVCFITRKLDESSRDAQSPEKVVKEAACLFGWASGRLGSLVPDSGYDAITCCSNGIPLHKLSTSSSDSNRCYSNS